jgi:hypothetical protein
MHHHGSSDHRLLIARKLDLMVQIIQPALPEASLPGSHVAHMPLGGVWPGVRFVGWIK